MGTLPNCHYCGKFVGWKAPYYTWTYYGSVLDYEPPDPCFAHQRCHEVEGKGRNIDYITWQKPQLITPKEPEVEATWAGYPLTWGDEG